MLIEDCIKELRENPKKEYQAKWEGFDLNLVRINANVVVKAFIKGDEVSGRAYYPINLDWQEVKQPVTWQEAIQAWVDGKDFKVEYGCYTFEQSSEQRLGCSKQSSVYGFCEAMFTTGKWYIE